LFAVVTLSLTHTPAHHFLPIIFFPNDRHSWMLRCAS
jgi:hypothetical protein